MQSHQIWTHFAVNDSQLWKTQARAHSQAVLPGAIEEMLRELRPLPPERDTVGRNNSSAAVALGL